MKKEQIMGLLREFLTALGGLVWAGSAGWPSLVGLIVMVASLVWGFYYNEGAEIIYTAIRKLLSAAPAVGVELGWLDIDQATNLVALLLPASAMVWSYISKGGGNPPSAFPVVILFAALSFLFPSCAGLQVTPDGCLLGTYSKNGQTYTAGPCVGAAINEDGKSQIDRFRVQWENAEGQTLRATYWVKSKQPAQLEYQLASGLWLTWDSKSGVLIGQFRLKRRRRLKGIPSLSKSKHR